MQFFFRYRSVTLLVVCLGLSLLMMSSANNPLTASLQSAFRPLHQGVARSVRGGSELWHRYLYLVGVEQSYEQALRELSQMRHELISLQEARHERDRLRALLGFQQRLGRPTTAARVIGWDSSHFAESLLCDRGARDGVQVNMCVTTSDGLVGRVLRVAPNSSQVQLVLDELSNVAALIQKNRVPGIVTGQGADKPLVMRYVPKSAEVSINDAVVASGIDGIYHKGLLIGYVSAVDNDSTSLFQKVEVRPSVDLERVEEVLIFSAAQLEPELEALQLDPLEDDSLEDEEAEGDGSDTSASPAEPADGSARRRGNQR